jgi:acetoacetyl-CoA synthetase
MNQATQGIEANPGAEGAEGRLLWEPSERWREATHMSAYMRYMAAREGIELPDYESLWRFSVQELERFWASIWDRFEVRCSARYTRVCAGEQMPGVRWFEGARLNFAENLLLHRPREPRPGAEQLPAEGLRAGLTAPVAPASFERELALLHSSELRGLESLTRGELIAWSAQIAGGLRALGVGPGDRVCAYMPNIVETLVAFLACASIGAVWSSAAPEFGDRAVIDRFAQIEPKLLLAVDGYRYAGRDFDRRPALAQIAASLPTLEHLVMLPYLDTRARPHSFGGARPRVHTWAALEELGAGAQPQFEQLPFDHPLWVLYSSGTTGLPKAIVHGHGGMLIEQLKKSHLHLDLHGGERIFWQTTTGWMMWNFLIGCLLSDAAIILYDGAPANPSTDTLFALAQETRMSTLGTSAGFITSAIKEQAGSGKAQGRLAERFDLSALRAVGSTGSPLSPAAFEWTYSELGPELWLFSTSGGTDVCTAFVSGCPLLPVRAGEIQARALGCAVESFDEAGRPIREALGELVITKPMPSMPLYMWGDRDGSRYRESYFERFPGVWRHGDWIKITERGSVVIYGRSDATINRGGVRMGTAEIYRVLEAHPAVREAMVVDLPRGGAEGRLGGELELVLFVVLQPDAAFDQRSVDAIKQAIRSGCSPRHVPDRVIATPALPRTLSGKLIELPVKRILCGARPESALSADALADPGALTQLLAAARAAGVGALAE